MKQFIAFIVLCVTFIPFIILAVLASFIGQTDPVVGGYESFICGIHDECGKEGKL